METSRVLLRRFSISDLPYMEEMESDAEVMRYTSAGQALPKEKIKERLEKIISEERLYHPYGVWAGLLKDNNDLVGWFMLRRHRSEDLELGYMIRKKYWGQGFATEVALRLVNFGFDKMGEEFITAVTSPENSPSIAVLEKIGFQFQKKIEVEERGEMVRLNFYKIYNNFE